MKKCDSCNNKTIMTEAQLYCTESCFGLGDHFPWCRAYNSDIEQMEYFKFDFSNCEKYKSL